MEKPVQWVSKTHDHGWVNVANEVEARDATWTFGEYGVIIGERYIKSSPTKIYSSAAIARRNAKRAQKRAVEPEPAETW